MGDNIYADIEVHPKTDVPQFYPQHTASIGVGMLLLCNPHDENYKPTEEQKVLLKGQIQNSKTWAYLRVLPSRVRES